MKQEEHTKQPLPIRKEANNKQLTLYEVIVDDLLEQIKRNDFSYDIPICTEKLLSEKYGVSRITAKRAITELEQKGILFRTRGVGSFVSPGVDITSSFAPLPGKSLDLKTFALQIPFIVTAGGVIDTVQVISDFLDEGGYSLGVYISNKNAAKEKASLKRLTTQHINGLIYYPFTNQIHLELLNELVLEGKPVIIIDKTTDCPYIHNVTSDNFEGGRLLTEHLISLGHKNIAFLCNAPLEKTSSIRDRFGGFLNAMKQHGQNPGANSLINMNGSLGAEGAESPVLDAAVRRLHSNGITAIEAENDAVAFSILRSCQKLGLRVPEDISICGFDDNMWSRNTTPAITTIAQDFQGIGKAVSALLKDLLTTPNMPAKKVVIPVQLIVRGSTAIPDKPE